MLLKLINYSKEVDLIWAGALPRIMDGGGGVGGCEEYGGRSGEQVAEARFCLSDLSRQRD